MQCTPSTRSDLDRKRAYYLHTQHTAPKHTFTPAYIVDSTIRSMSTKNISFMKIMRFVRINTWFLLVLLLSVLLCVCVIPLVVVIVTIFSVLIALEEFRVFSSVLFLFSPKVSLACLFVHSMCIPNCLYWQKFVVL